MLSRTFEGRLAEVKSEKCKFLGEEASMQTEEPRKGPEATGNWCVCQFPEQGGGP